MKDNQKKQLELNINDQPITLNPFTENLIKNIILSIVNSLRLKESPEKIEINIKQ